MSARAQVVEHYPERPLMGVASLITMAYQGCNLAPLGQQLLVQANTNCIAAMMDLSVLLQVRGDHDTGIALQHEALKQQQLFNVALKPAHPIRLLALLAPGDLMTNMPLEFVVEGAGIALDILYVAPHLPFPESLPEHDIAIVAVSELDRNLPVLEMLNEIVPHWPRPVLNLPDKIAVMSRDRICHRLSGIAGVSIPLTNRVSRVELEQVLLGNKIVPELLHGDDLPIIIRPIDSHAGDGLARLTVLSELKAYLQKRSEERFFISRFVDYSDSQGRFRKFRIVLMNGKPYIAHMAISEHWMVHYLNAGMTDSVEKRAIEANVMATFDQDFARRHSAAFENIAQRIGMDYFGIDCSETAKGELLIFEAGSSMVVHAMDPIDLFPYKQPVMRKLFAGFQRFLLDKMAQSDAGTANDPPCDNRGEATSSGVNEVAQVD